MEETLYKNITANDFMNIDFKNVTLVDLREPDEVLVSGIEGAINIPFSSFPKGIDDIPKDKPVYVYCREGNFSEELADILADRGYDVYNLTGGYKEYRKLITGEEINGKPEVVNKTISNSEEVYIDAKNLRCPGPIVKVADTIRNLPDGERGGLLRTAGCGGDGDRLPARGCAAGSVHGQRRAGRHIRGV